MPKIFDTDIKVKQNRIIIIDNEKGHREKAEITLKNEEAKIVITAPVSTKEPFIQGQTVTVKISQEQIQLPKEDDQKGEKIEGEDINKDEELEGENPFGEDKYIPEEDLENA